MQPDFVKFLFTSTKKVKNTLNDRFVLKIKVNVGYGRPFGAYRSARASEGSDTPCFLCTSFSVKSE